MSQKLPDWVRLSDGWHCPLGPGVPLTRCGKKVPDGVATSATPMPTICDKCRKHYRELKRAAQS